MGQEASTTASGERTLLREYGPARTGARIEERVRVGMVDEASRAAVGDLLLDHYGRRHHHLVHHTDRGAPGDEHAFDAGQRGPNGDGVPHALSQLGPGQARIQLRQPEQEQ